MGIERNSKTKKRGGDMCYILYGAVNKEINRENYERVTAKYPYHIRPGTRHDVKMCLLKDDYTYRVTDWVCDCKFPLGMKDPWRTRNAVACIGLK